MATTDLLSSDARTRSARPAQALRATVRALAVLAGCALVLVGVIAAAAGSHAPSALAVDAAWGAVGVGALTWGLTARRRMRV
jgi:hypothetical protein